MCPRPLLVGAAVAAGAALVFKKTGGDATKSFPVTHLMGLGMLTFHPGLARAAGR